MPRSLHNLVTFREVFTAGGMQYANYLINQGKDEGAVLSSLGSRFPDTPPSTLASLLDITNQARQAALELGDLPSGQRKPPSGLPQPDGAKSFGYTVEVSIGQDLEGNEIPIMRTVAADDFLTYEELIRFASDQVREIIKKYPDQFNARGITLQTLSNWNVQLAWAKEQFPAISEFLESNPLEE